ncbi:ATP-grasp domain-containing protein [bacterium]|jgi:D-alanine--D-alanine ligase|nr:ATP-grasp domain-containing protein [bacterium]MBT5015024.1 ATP-grasp domain-containing protein [bacterium]
MKKLNVGVFMGGKSIENEVSFNSGRTVCDHLDTTQYNVIPLFQRFNGEIYILPLRFLHRGKITDFDHRLEAEAEKVEWEDLKSLVDFIYLAAHGRYMEDGSIQGMFEMLRIPYLGSKVFASALGMDKIIQRHVLNAEGIDTPKYTSFSVEEIDDFVKNETMILERIEQAGIKFPIVIKPSKEGSSLGISILKNKNGLKEALHDAAYLYRQKPHPIIIEEKIEGMEFTCIIITDPITGEPIPLPPTEVVAEEGSHFFDYDQKYMPGRAHKFTPARCSDEHIKLIQQTCIKAMNTLEISNLSRIDGFLMQDGTISIIDPNTISGMGPSFFLFRQAAEINMSHTQLINHLIETELHRYKMTTTLDAKRKNQEALMNNKIRVSVLLGGRSNEREISLESGRNIVYKLSPEKYEVTPIFVNKDLDLYTINQRLLVSNSTKEIENSITDDMKISWTELKRSSDFTFIGLHGGEGENGSVQGTLEMLDMPYNGSGVLASAMCMDKVKTNHYLQERGFDIPKNVFVSKNEWRESQANTLDMIHKSLPLYPLIIKPHDDGCSVMVQKAKNDEQLAHALKAIFAEKSHALVEECIEGMELTVGIIGNSKPYALPPSETVVSKDILSIEEKFLPGAGENQTPARLSESAIRFVRKTIEEIYEALGCKGYARLDCFYQDEQQSPTGKERIVFIEANTLPGMTPATCLFHQAAEIGVKPMDFIDIVVKLGMQLHKPVMSEEDKTSLMVQDLIKEKAQQV